ncbi:hypothetical protein D6D01_07335 [Aureobasidium pullulans]|uniref:Uncharacterized protein n=1 Tax=Aureobasidium pullulans TaxID=5580 RepID=A0A4V4JTL5_AURPU|nr:hypothetical protein D6D01_07335 [Aureobasidium pullulans]
MPGNMSVRFKSQEFNSENNLPLMQSRDSMEKYHDDSYDASSEDSSSQSETRSPLQRHWLFYLTLIMNGILTIVMFSLLIWISVIQKRNYDIFAHVPPYQSEIIYTPGIAPPLLGPEFQKHTEVFHRNESFMGEKTKAYPAWHEILHRARHGRVAFESRPGEFFGIGGYHELHCVWLLQQTIDKAINGVVPDEIEADHLYHCAEFLRQSVMCHADNTIERRFEGILGPFSANNTHVCGNWWALMDWADAHKYTGVYLNPTFKLPP